MKQHTGKIDIISVKINSNKPEPIHSACCILEEYYDVILRSQLKSNDRDDGFHLLLTLQEKEVRAI